MAEELIQVPVGAVAHHEQAVPLGEPGQAGGHAVIQHACHQLDAGALSGLEPLEGGLRSGGQLGKKDLDALREWPAGDRTDAVDRHPLAQVHLLEGKIPAVGEGGGYIRKGAIQVEDEGVRDHGANPRAWRARGGAGARMAARRWDSPNPGWQLGPAPAG